MRREQQRYKRASNDKYKVQVLLLQYISHSKCYGKRYIIVTQLKKKTKKHEFRPSNNSDTISQLLFDTK